VAHQFGRINHVLGGKDVMQSAALGRMSTLGRRGASSNGTRSARAAGHGPFKRKDGAHSNLFEDPVFGRVHPFRLRGRRIVVAAQMKQSVQRVEEKFVFHRVSPLPGLSLCYRQADDDLAFNDPVVWIAGNLEAQHVRDHCSSKIRAMQPPHGLRIHNGNRNGWWNSIDDRCGIAQSAAQQRRVIEPRLEQDIDPWAAGHSDHPALACA
jgi:hypothetical protein